jgi:hypothetical protein
MTYGTAFLVDTDRIWNINRKLDVMILHSKLPHH